MVWVLLRNSMHDITWDINQWQCQKPKLEAPTIYKAYVGAKVQGNIPKKRGLI